MSGKLIVFEGTDGSGKSTQFKLACEALKNAGLEFRTCRYPQYQEESSAPVRMYLRGEFGRKPSDVNAYAASSFYAVDRYAGYKKHWGEFYHNGGTMVLDRYTTSNAVHQSSKMDPADREDFFQWLADFEYVQIGLPTPDLVICGTHDGYFKDDAAPAEIINQAQADVVFVCLGAPRQEKWIVNHGAATGASLLIGLGGSLDVFAGRVERAPEAWQKAGMEWLYRAIKQPERLKRVAKLPLFLCSAVGARIKGK